MTLRTALVVVALVVAPMVVFAVAKSTSTPARAGGWSAYAPSGSNIGAEDTSAERTAITSDVVRWKRHHPGGSCRITPPSSARCMTADGSPADLEARVATVAVPSASP
jgi:hypothetical protein